MIIGLQARLYSFASSMRLRGLLTVNVTTSEAAPLNSNAHHRKWVRRICSAYGVLGPRNYASLERLNCCFDLTGRCLQP